MKNSIECYIGVPDPTGSPPLYKDQNIYIKNSLK